jgi:hypothetical protein
VDLVLGLSMTSADVRWALVEGTTAEGPTFCRDAVDYDTLDDVLSAVGDNRLHAIGVTWTAETEAAASTLLDALADRGLGNVIAVSELEAADTLATGIADRGGYDDVLICIVEPDGALVTRVDPDGVSTERTEPSADDMLAVLDRGDDQPDAIFVLGSTDDIDSIVSAVEAGTEAPVISAAEADLALARGAALASAQAVNTLDAPSAPLRWPSKSGALVSVLVAAMLTFVISLSIALGMRLAPDSTVAQQQAAAEEPAPAAVAPSVAVAVPHPKPPAAPPPPPRAPPEVDEVTAARPEVPPPAAEPVYEPPAATPPAPVYVPPVPAYVPPAPAPAYVPPPPAPAYVPPPPQPRLRDRIIERIPIINRFHEPAPYG